MSITLLLDPEQKSTLEELFLASAQLPSMGLGDQALIEDSLAVFRFAKEFGLRSQTEESQRVDMEDLVRALRFICWLFFYTTALPANPMGDRTRRLRQLFATIVFQAQAQNPSFESLLRSFGVDRQLDSQLHKPHRRPQGGSKSEMTTLTQDRMEKVQRVRLQLTTSGAELTSETSESSWRASASRQTTG